MPESEPRFEHVKIDFRLPTWFGDPSIAGLPVSICGVSIRKQMTGKGSRLGDYCFECQDENAIERAHAVISALLLSSDASIKQTARFFGFGNNLSRTEKCPENDYSPLWGHYTGQISAESIAFAQRNAELIRELQRSQTFNRIGNALHFYSVGLHAHPDSAAVLFTAVLEAVLGDAAQELSFRLALAASHWLGRTVEERFLYFNSAKSLYGQRSKIVHGSKLTNDLEEAAINLVENTVPADHRDGPLKLVAIAKRMA